MATRSFTIHDIRPAARSTARQPCAFCGRPRTELVPMEAWFEGAAYPVCEPCRTRLSAPAERATMKPLQSRPSKKSGTGRGFPKTIYPSLAKGVLVMWRPAPLLRVPVQVVEPGKRITRVAVLSAAGATQHEVKTTLLHLIYCDRCGESLATVASRGYYCTSCANARATEEQAAAAHRDHFGEVA